MKYIIAIKIQLIMILIVTMLFCASFIGIIPTIYELLDYLKVLFQKYGVVAVMICAFFENIAGFNLYFPGSIVILTSMALSAGNPKMAFSLFVIISVFSILAHLANYLVFRLLDKKNDKKENCPKLSEYFLSFWHPHFAVVVSIKSGARGVPFIIFFKRMVVAAISWYIFWAVVMYSYGTLTVSKNAFGLIWLFLLYLIIWTIWDIVNVRKGN